ncbi:MAG: DUF192 domain-containing protein [Brevinema sp.]
MKTSLMITFLFLSQTYNIELAITSTEKATGLMFRKEWTEDSQGMLFINEKAQKVSFWMKNTYLNMIIFYLDKDFNILQTFKAIPLSTNSMTSKTDDVKYVLELNSKLEQKVRNNWKDFSHLLKMELENNQDDIKRFLSI